MGELSIHNERPRTPDRILRLRLRLRLPVWRTLRLRRALSLRVWIPIQLGICCPVVQLGLFPLRIRLPICRIRSLWSRPLWLWLPLRLRRLRLRRLWPLWIWLPVLLLLLLECCGCRCWTPNWAWGPILALAFKTTVDCNSTSTHENSSHSYTYQPT